MFCDGCGAATNPSGYFCSSCGKRLVASAGFPATQPTARAYSDDRVKRNINALTTAWLVYGIVRMIGALALYSFGHLVFPWMGPHDWFVTHRWGWEQLVPFGIYTGGAFAVAFAAAYLLLAWGLSEHQPWARSLAIVLSFFVLLRIPLGTALGVYTLWVLLPDPSRREYEQLAHA
jgi:hypothetical protein